MIRIYLQPFDDAGMFGEEIEVTSDVDRDALGKIKRSLGDTTYDIGILRYNNLSLKLQNWHGKYSDVDNLKSVFRFRRSGSKVRVTWAPAAPAICGIAVCGESILSEEVTIYRGILNDDASVMDADDQIMHFDVLSYDSQFSKVIVPYSDLSGSDTLKDILVKILDQAAITRYATVDSEDINLEVDYIPDDLTWFENKTGKEAIEKILLVSNSVLYIDQDSIIATGRTPSDEVKESFFGQNSAIGNENITGINDFRNGNNRIINFVRWQDSSVSESNGESIGKWGVFLKELDVEFVTDSDKQSQSAESIVDEFKEPKKELRLETFITADSIELKFLDKVDIDYPTVVEASGKYLPVVGLTQIGDFESPLPRSLWDFNLNQDQKFKIMGIEVDLKRELISFDLRGI